MILNVAFIIFMLLLVLYLISQAGDVGQMAEDFRSVSLVWRFISYYLFILAGFVAVAIDQSYHSRQRKKGLDPAPEGAEEGLPAATMTKEETEP